MDDELLPPVRHLRYRGAFGLPFLWHHAVSFGAEPAPGCPDTRTVVHWSSGGDAGQSKVEALENAEILRAPYSTFAAAAANASREGAEEVLYPPAVLAANPPATQAARAAAMVGRRGLGMDGSGSGYCPAQFNCEHLAVFIMTGEARSSQSDQAGALAEAAWRGLSSGSASEQISWVGLGLGALALTAVAVAEDAAAARPPAAADAPSAPQGEAPEPLRAARERPPCMALLQPPPAAAWGAPVARTRAAGYEMLPLSAIVSGGALNVELLDEQGAAHTPRRWLSCCERHDALPFGLCFGHRLHAEALRDDVAPPLLALPSFQFWFRSRPGRAPPGGLRGVLLAAPAGRDDLAVALFGLHHLRRRKFVAAGRCAAFPGSDVDAIFHLGLAVSSDEARTVTLVLADYADGSGRPPVEEGYAFRWVEAGAGGRAFPCFAAAPEGAPSAVPPARFRLWLRAAD